ncbi:MAG: PPOX class F420-dependent oxidoreductase [Microthrixaceae bacterium]
MDMDTALAWASTRHNGTLITLRKDGRAQSSDISYAVIDGAPRISVTADRAKTANMRRDPRVVLHMSDPSNWAYLSLDATAELSAVAAQPNDETCDRLVEYFEAVAGKPHDNWEEYRRAMVDDGRLLVTLRPNSAVGQI